MGLGSTAVACAELGVDFIGIEMDRGYLDEAVARARAALKTHRPVRKKAHSLKGQ
jgi:DNA modification methylase